MLTLQASVGLRLLDALSEAALELNEKLPGGHVEVRLTGQDPELVFVSEEPEAPAAAADEAYTARITPAAARRRSRSAHRDRSNAARASPSTPGSSARSRAARTAAPAAQSGNRLTGYARG